MYKLLISILVCLLATYAYPQESGHRMSRDELLAFLPGAKVIHVSQAGSERHWINEPDGSLFANSNNKLFGSSSGTQGASQAGTWLINDDGKYCIDIDWKRVHEKWCAAIIKTQDGSYYLNSVDEKRKIGFVPK